MCKSCNQLVTFVVSAFTEIAPEPEVGRNAFFSRERSCLLSDKVGLFAAPQLTPCCLLVTKATT